MLDSCGSGQGPMSGSCEKGQQILDSIKYGEFLTR